MKASQRSCRRRLTCVALLWISLVRGHAPSSVTLGSPKEPGAPPSLCRRSHAGAQGESLWSRSNGAAVPTPPLVRVGTSSHSLGGACSSTSTSALPPDNGTLVISQTAVAVATARQAVLELSGGAIFHRNSRNQARRPQPPQPPRSDTRTYAMDRSAGSGTAWPEISRVLNKCLARAGSGGLPGAMAGLLQVVTLMWLRTIVNYQCRYGTSIGAAASELYRQGGVLRFYRGVVFALVSNPLSRFGMAAANEGAIALTDALPRKVSVTFTTWIASLFAGVWRVVLTPLDTCKTVLQVEGPKGFASLMKKVWAGNLGCLYQGATAAAAATAVGYFPWFLTFNYLNGLLRKPSAMAWMLLRNAGIGLASSVSSDVCSNSIRVLKTTKQAAAAYDAKVTYRGAAALVIEKDGLLGLFGRGLSTRILANGLQSMLFTVVWRYLHDKYVVPRREAAELREAKEARGVGGSRGRAIRQQQQQQQQQRRRFSSASARTGRSK